MILPRTQRSSPQLGAFDFTTLLPVIGNELTPFLSQAVINQYSTIEVRTTVSPPVVMRVADLLDNKAPPSAFSKFLQPTVILTDKAGVRNVIAPYGIAENGSALPGVMVLLAIVGAGFVLGRLSKH